MEQPEYSPEELKAQIGHLKQENIHQLEEYVPLEEQQEYMLLSTAVRYGLNNADELLPTHAELDKQLQQLDLLDPEDKEALRGMHILMAQIGNSRSIDLLRALESILAGLAPPVRYWALMARLELRMRIVGDLTDEQQVVIASALGGRNSLIRFNGFVCSRGLVPLAPYQQELFDQELCSVVADLEGEVERVEARERYILFTFLLPYDTDISQTIQTVLERCEEYGDFLDERCHISNAYLITHADVERIIDKYLTSQTPS